MKIQIIENTVDTIVANVGEPCVDGPYTTITVAEYWIDKDNFVMYNELFDNDGQFIDYFEDEVPYNEDEREYIKNYLINSI